MSASLTPALALPPEVRDVVMPMLEKLVALEKQNGGCHPENVRKMIPVIRTLATLVEERPVRPETIIDVLPDLRREDPERYWQVVRAASEVSREHRDEYVSVLTEDERAACLKLSAGRSEPSSSRAPAVKSRNGHEGQLRSPDGRWRPSLFRRVVDASAQPKLPGAKFFTG